MPLVYTLIKKEIFMENTDSILVSYAKNLTKQNFNSTISLSIDSNVNIKTILNVDSFIYDEKVECANGKAIISGKIGVKVLYIDTDNMTNTVADSTTFSETILDESITADGHLNVADISLVNTILSSDGNLKINVDVSIYPVLYINVGLNTKNNFENMIVKKSEIDTSTISCVVDSNFEYTLNFETKDGISKILSYNAYFCPNEITAYDEYAVVEGKMFARLVYETNKDDTNEIKELSDSFSVKSELPIAGLTKDAVLDLSFNLNKNKDALSTEMEDGNSVVTVTNTICVYGVAVKPISIDVVDDMYSTDNEVELTLTTREFNTQIRREKVQETISGEISLTESEPAIDDVLCNLNISPEITNTYIKDGTLYLEGIVTSHLTYLDENKACQHKQTELPFVINTKIELANLSCVHTSISVLDNKVKARRGTIIELEYTLHINLAIYQNSTRELIDNISIGKAVDFSEYDYQIYLAKPNETMWELCKRTKVTPEDILKLNKNLPEVLLGGEKIIIKR